MTETEILSALSVDDYRAVPEASPEQLARLQALGYIADNIVGEWRLTQAGVRQLYRPVSGVQASDDVHQDNTGQTDNKRVEAKALEGKTKTIANWLIGILGATIAAILAGIVLNWLK